MSEHRVVLEDDRSIYDLHSVSNENPRGSDAISVIVLDLVVTALAMPLVVVIVGICWLVIKVSEPGNSVFFLQTRYGMGGRPFKLIKLRTMVKDAEAMKMELIHLSEDKGPGFKIKNDPRITKIGRFLRKTHLDELPQFFNVIRGEMSIVGPRANSYDPSHYEPWQLRRLSVKPGITGAWQIAREKPQDFAERCRMDIDYLERRSFWLDLQIILATAVAVLRAPGD